MLRCHGVAINNMKLLFVCLGNICRSPLAAAIMANVLKERGVHCVIESAGTADWNVAQPADLRAIKVARANGIDLSVHRARQLRREDFDKFDHIIVMDRSNENFVRKMAPPAMRNKIRLIAKGTEVLDPYHQDESAFDELSRLLYEYCNALADDLQL